MCQHLLQFGAWGCPPLRSGGPAGLLWLVDGLSTVCTLCAVGLAELVTLALSVLAASMWPWRLDQGFLEEALPWVFLTGLWGTASRAFISSRCSLAPGGWLFGPLVLAPVPSGRSACQKAKMVGLVVPVGRHCCCEIVGRVVG